MPKIKGSQIRDETITGTQINNDTLTGDDINESTLKVTFISDLDADTKIQVEESADEDKIRFDVAGSEAVIIDSNGRLGINTSSPDYKLDVSGNIGLNEYLYHNGDSDTNVRFETNQVTVSAGGQSFLFDSGGDLSVPGSITTQMIRSDSDIDIDANGGQIYMKDNGVTYLTFNVNGTTDKIEATGHLKLEATADIYLNAKQGDIYIQDNGVQRIRVEDTTGDVSIGSHSPSYRLDVRDNTSTFVMNIQQESSTSGADMLRMDFSSEIDPTGQIIYVYDQGNDRIYQVVGNGAGGSTVNTSFTAGHDTVVPQSNEVVPGMILESTGVVWYKPTNVTSETALPKCQMASVNGSKKVFGVVAGFPATDSPKEEDIPYVHNGYVMAPSFPSYAKKAGVLENEWNIGTMSIGEGVIWVTNINGSIENGDLIESSEIPGYGRLQLDDIIRSKTVAKCTEDIPWESINDLIDLNGVQYKKYLASCTFHCG